MKYLLVLACVVVLSYSSPVLGPTNPNNHTNLTVVPSDLKILFYSKTTGDNGIQVYLDNIDTLHNTDYSPSKPTIFSIHGYGDDWTAAVNVEVRNSYLAVRDVNIFVVDWSKYAKADPNQAFASAAECGNVLGQLINNMISSAGLDLGNTFIVAHSLGGIVAGSTGSTLGSQLDHIVALDPAPFDKSTAKFVQVIHTTYSGAPYGHADYYVNGGGAQPGCNEVTPGGCSHWRSIVYFGESVRSGNFKARKCSDYNTYLSGGCNNNEASNMGQAEIDKTASGSYYLQTNSEAPFARG